MSHSSVALLVDGDNISAKYAEQIVNRANEFGSVTVQNVYGRANSLRNWADKKEYEQIEVQPLKKAADFHRSFDAVEMAANGVVDAFIIVSSDRDLAHIASRLKAREIPVLGIGEPKAPSELKVACGNFHRLHCEIATQKAKELVNAVFTQRGNSRTGIPLNKIDGLVRKEDSSFRIGDTLFGRWAKFFEVNDDAYSVTGSMKKCRVHRILPN